MSKASKKRSSTSKTKKPLSLVQKIILGVIALATLTIIIATFSISFAKSENIVKSKIEALASDYYENFLYESLLNSDNYSNNAEEILSKYNEIGLTAVTLRDIILHDTQKTADIAPLLEKHCDRNKTTIKFYPTAPYTKTSYRADYTYSCEF